MASGRCPAIRRMVSAVCCLRYVICRECWIVKRLAASIPHQTPRMDRIDIGFHRTGTIRAADFPITDDNHFMKPIIELKNLLKRFKDQTAVDSINLAIAEGICFGLLGPNGAGKTTTLEMIEGITEPTSGQILYRSQPRGDSFSEEIGIQLQHTTLLSFLTIRETLRVFSKLYRHSADIDDILSLCSLSEIQKQYNDKISGGQRQRLMLAISLINDPSLLFLDEPSTGLDPQARQNLWAIIDTIKMQGRTIILTTHAMKEAERLCDEIAIMDQGKIIARGDIPSLLKAHCFDASGNPLCEPNLENVFLRLTGRQLRE